MRHLLNNLCVQNELFFIGCLSLFYHTSRENELDRGKNWLKSKCKKKLSIHFHQKVMSKKTGLNWRWMLLAPLLIFLFCFVKTLAQCNTPPFILYFKKKVLKDWTLSWTNVGFFKCFLMKGILDKRQDIKSCHLFIWSLYCNV